MRLLITGATGYLGSEILKHLVEGGDEIGIVKREQSSLFRIKEVLPRLCGVWNIESGVDEIFESGQFDGIIHCATDYGRKNTTPVQIIQANLILPLTLLTQAAKHGVKLFVNTDTILDKRVSDYSLSKRHFNDWLQRYSPQMTCINMALEHFYGPGDDKSKFVTWVLDSILSGTESIGLTKGEQSRDFICISDVVEAFATVLKDSQKLEAGYYRYEIGSGHSVTIRDLVTRISTLCMPHRTELKFGEKAYRVNEVMESKTDIEPLKKLGWVPRVSLDAGLDAMVRQEKQMRGMP